MSIGFDEMQRNQSLSSFMERSSKPSKEEMVEGLIMDSEGISTDDLQKRLKDKHGVIINKKNLEEIIITINKKYVEELDRQVIVYKESKWWWRQ